MIRDKIKQIKYSRLKKHERYFINLIDSSIKNVYDDRPDFIYWKYQDFIIFEYNINNNYLYINTIFYNYLSDYFKTGIEIKKYIKNIVSNYFNIEIEKVFPLHLDFF